MNTLHELHTADDIRSVIDVNSETEPTPETTVTPVADAADAVAKTSPPPSDVVPDAGGSKQAITTPVAPDEAHVLGPLLPTFSEKPKSDGEAKDDHDITGVPGKTDADGAPKDLNDLDVSHDTRDCEVDCLQSGDLSSKRAVVDERHSTVEDNSNVGSTSHGKKRPRVDEECVEMRRCRSYLARVVKSRLDPLYKAKALNRSLYEDIARQCTRKVLEQHHQPSQDSMLVEEGTLLKRLERERKSIERFVDRYVRAKLKKSKKG